MPRDERYCINVIIWITRYCDISWIAYWSKHHRYDVKTLVIWVKYHPRNEVVTAQKGIPLLIHAFPCVDTFSFGLRSLVTHHWMNQRQIYIPNLATKCERFAKRGHFAQKRNFNILRWLRSTFIYLTFSASLMFVATCILELYDIVLFEKSHPKH